MGIQRIGDWTKAQIFLKFGPTAMKTAANLALRREAENFRKEVVEGIKNQAPGGEKFTDLSAFTIATRRFKKFRGTKALIVRGDLRRSIKTHKAPGGYFVGIHRMVKHRTGAPLVNIAAVHEFGAKITIRVTDKMRRYLRMIFRLAGLMTGAGGPSQLSGQTMVVEIPPRPYLRPVAEKIKPGIAKRVVDAVTKGMMGI